MSTAREPELLLACARLQFDASFGAEISADLLQAIDWTCLVQTALDHGVASMLCSSLLLLDHLPVPDEIVAACTLHLQQQRQCNQQKADELCHLVEELKRIGIEAVPFKGPTLADQLYRDIGKRSFRDLDFLIREEDTARAIALLEVLGYQQNIPELTPEQEAAYHRYGGQVICFGAGTPIEPHWAFAPHTFAVDLDYPGLWQRVRSVRFNGHEVLGLSPEDQLLLLCLHGTKEKWSKLKWITDVAAFINVNPGLEWGVIEARARGQGIERMTLLGLLLAKKLGNVNLPLDMENLIRLDPRLEQLAIQVCRDLFNPARPLRSIYSPCAFHWHARERFSDRCRYLFRTLATPRITHFQSLALPNRLFFLYYPFKLLHDYLLLPLWLVCKSIRRANGGSPQKIPGHH